MQEHLAKTGYILLKKHLLSLRCGAYAELNNVFSKSSLVQDVSNAMQTKFTDEWQQSVNQIEGNRGRGLNKLRTYRLFKTQYGTERYCQLLLPLKNIDQLSLSSEWELHPLILKLADIGI